jgi:hypothetical protein
MAGGPRRLGPDLRPMPRHRIPTTSAAHCEARWDATSPTGKLAVSQREPARAGFGSLRDGHRPGHECRCGRRLATTQLSGMVGRRSPAGGTLDGSDRSKARGCPTFQVRCSRNGDRRSRHGSSYARQGQDSCAGTAALSGPQESTRHRLSGAPPPWEARLRTSLSKYQVPSARAQRPIFAASGRYHDGRSSRGLSPLTTPLEADEACGRTVARAPSLARGRASMRAVP